MRLDPASRWERAEFFRSNEPDTARFLRAQLGPGRVFYDCGANLGLYSLLAAAVGASVVAFEPTPKTFDRLVVNVEANRFDVQCLALALADRSGRETIYELSDTNSGMNTLTHGTPVAEVEVARLDDLELPAPHLLKIDVEGSELALLAGAAETIRRHRPTLVVELSGWTSSYVGATTQDVVDRIFELGNWQMWWLRGRRPVAVRRGDLPHERVLEPGHGWNYAFTPLR
jgi:FkbM family methyltransferase